MLDLKIADMRLVVLTLAAFLAASGPAAAQSVLERVLGHIDGATNLTQVNGVYANIAESISDRGTVTTTTTETVPLGIADAPDGTSLFGIDGPTQIKITTNDIGKTYIASDDSDIGRFISRGNIDTITVDNDGTLTIIAENSTSNMRVYNSATDESIDLIAGPVSETILIPDDSYVYSHNGFLFMHSEALFETYPLDPSGEPYFLLQTQEITTTVTGTNGLFTTIDGSISNVITGITEPTSVVVVGKMRLVEYTLSTIAMGDMSTTALGAVNTGEVTLGVNSAVDEAKTSSTRAVSAVMTQIGGSADTGTLVLNVASNSSQVIGSIENTLVAVNGSIGDLSTTALGAVNTGAITSGVNAAVQGIVGMSGQAGAGL